MLPSTSACGTSRCLTHNFHVLLDSVTPPFTAFAYSRAKSKKRSPKPSRWFLNLNNCSFYWRHRLQCNRIFSIAPKFIVLPGAYLHNAASPEQIPCQSRFHAPLQKRDTHASIITFQERQFEKIAIAHRFIIKSKQLQTKPCELTLCKFSLTI